MQFTPVLALCDPFGVDVPLNLDNTHSLTHVRKNVILLLVPDIMGRQLLCYRLPNRSSFIQWLLLHNQHIGDPRSFFIFFATTITITCIILIHNGVAKGPIKIHVG